MTLSKLKLKPLTTEQLEAVVALDRLCLGGLWTLGGYERELASPNSELLGLSVANTPARAGERLVGIGCFWAILEESHITLLAVDPNYRGQGLGQTLLLALLKEAIARQLERATLEVRSSNQAALTLYHQFGFQLAGRRKGYYKDPEEDASILWLNGLQSPNLARTLGRLQQKAEDKLRKHQWKFLDSALPCP